MSYKDKVSMLFTLFLKKRNPFNENDFKKEIIAANKLIKKYPDFDFFFSLPSYTDKFNSLFGLLSVKVQKDLSKKYKDFILEKSKKKIIY